MKIVTMYQTQDGRMHTDEQIARKHADNLYGHALTLLAHEMVKLQKFTQMQDFIDTRLDEFVRLKALRDDAKLERPAPIQGDEAD